MCVYPWVQGQRIKAHLVDCDSGAQTEMLSRLPTVERKTGLFLAVGSGTGFQLNDECLLLPRALNIDTSGSSADED